MNNIDSDTEELTQAERNELLFYFHWPKEMFPDKKFTGQGTKAECDYYKIPKTRLKISIKEK
jgi:hypothetical protein